MKCILYIASGGVLALGCGSDNNANVDRAVSFPDSVLVSRFSPDSSLKATLFYWRDEDANFLAKDRWCLGFSNGNADWFISRDLGEGKGFYEGGVFDIQWLDDHRLIIDRRIDDQDADLIFNVQTHEFQPSE